MYNIIYLYVRALFMIGIKNDDNITKKVPGRNPCSRGTGFAYAYICTRITATIV